MKYGIMQGRLLPKFKGLYQSHPIENWGKEFEIASNLNLESIEFIFDYHLYSFNPIFSAPELVYDYSSKSGVKVKSICADYFMSAPIQYGTNKELNIYGSILEKLINNLNSLGGNNIVIPFVDNSSLKKNPQKITAAKFLNEFKNICSKKSVSIAIESDFTPKEFLNFFELIDNNYITINYDSGNSASLGYCFEEEMKCYGNIISNIHIKDRVLGGGPVELGNGNAKLKSLKNFIQSKNYKGLVIFQAYRDNEGVEIFKKQLKYFYNL